MNTLYIISVVDLRGEFVEVENSVFNDKTSAFVALQNEFNYYKNLQGFNAGESWCEGYDNSMDFYAEFDGTNKYVTGTINSVSL